MRRAIRRRMLRVVHALTGAHDRPRVLPTGPTAQQMIVCGKCGWIRPGSFDA